MPLFDFFLRTTKAPQQTTGRVFTTLQNTAAPDWKAEEYLDAYGSSGWVYAAVDRTAEACADVPIRLERRSGKGWSEVEEHIALTTLHDANPLDTETSLRVATFSYLRLSGESIWFTPKGRATKKPAEIYPLETTRVKVAKSNLGEITGYTYRNEAGQDVPLDAKDVIHMRRFNPRNRYRGMGPLQAAAIAIDTDIYAGKHNRNFFFNSASPSAVLETEGTLTDEQMERLRNQWEAKYAGTDNAHKTAILEAGLTYKQVGLSQRDMEFLESRRFSRDEILNIMGVPKTIVGITDDVNLANAKVHEYVFAKYTVRPLVKFFVECLNEFYLPLFDLKRQEYRFTFEDPVPADVELELKRRESGIANGWLLVNEIREDEGLDTVEGGDQPFVSTALQPLAQALAEPQPAPASTPSAGENQDQPAAPAKAMTKAGEPIELRLAQLVAGEVELETQSLAVFDQQRDALLKRLKSKKDANLESASLIDKLFDGWEVWNNALADAIAGVVSTIYTFSASRTALSVSLSADFDTTNPRVRDFLDTRGLQSAKSVNGTIREEIRKRLIHGVEQGDSLKTIGESIKEFYGEQAEWRANRLARTEVKDAYAQGSLEAARQAQVTAKRWITSGAAGEPDICRANEAQGWIPLETAFASGDLAPTAHPNCKCDLIYRHDD